jgi:hypothetical protein
MVTKKGWIAIILVTGGIGVIAWKKREQIDAFIRDMHPDRT